MAVARFTLAVDRRFKQEGQPTADFIRCIAFGKTAEFFERFGRKGTKFLIETEFRPAVIQTRTDRKYTQLM